MHDGAQDVHVVAERKRREGGEGGTHTTQPCVGGVRALAGVPAGKLG